MSGLAHVCSGCAGVQHDTKSLETVTAVVKFPQPCNVRRSRTVVVPAIFRDVDHYKVRARLC